VDFCVSWTQPPLLRMLKGEQADSVIVQGETLEACKPSLSILLSELGGAE